MMSKQGKRMWRCCWVLILLAWTVSAPAAVPSALAPVLDDQAFMVMHFQVTTEQIDALVDEILGMIQTHVGEAGVAAFKDDLNGMRTRINKQLQVFQQAGGREIYVVWSQYDFPVPFAVVPVEPGAKIEDLVNHLKTFSRQFNAELLNPHLIIAGEAKTLARVRQLKASPEIPLAAAYQDQGSAAFAVTIAPNAMQRRIVAEMVPVIPVASGAIPVQQLLDHLQWGVFRLDTPPEMSLQVTLASQDSSRAQMLQDAIRKSYAVFGQHQAVRQLMPQVDGILAQLTPQQQGPRLSLAVNRSAADAMMKDLIAPSLLGIRTAASRMTCGTQLSGLGKAMLIYSNDYDDCLPLKWEDFKLAEVPDKMMQCPTVKTRGSYLYRGAGITVKAPPDTVIIHDRKGNHGDQRRNVVFLDSRVEWITEERFQELIRQDNKWRREHDLPEIAPE